ncbi:hypothetical protein [Finegoldia magna]|uniref:hypothetical protein n=1 Tax=Finegoldia magna TaxID=1260 RepID=UPI0039997A0F
MSKNKIFLSVIFAGIYFLWSLMPIFTAEYADDSIRTLFLGLMLMAIFCSVIENSFIIKGDKLLFLIILLMIVYFIMDIVNYADAHKYVNVVCFWLPFILSLVMKEKQRVQIAKWITLLLLIT